MGIKSKIQNLLKSLNDGVYEKEEAIALSLLSSISGESIFLLGAPGVAKSLVARKLKFAFKNSSSFEYLMNRFSTPDEIFGPVSIAELKNSRYERIIKNYLPTATVVFLDEIWKAGPSIQNSLLTVLNEKIYRNGDQEIHVPMKALISASNELPSKGEGLEALWDRFLVRLIVESVKTEANFKDMVSKSLNSYEDTIDENSKISDEEYLEWSKSIDQIEIPENVFSVIHVIRKYIQLHNSKEENQEKPIYISDRRWRKIVRLLRTSAFLNARTSVDLMDCFLIKDCLWNEPEQKDLVSQLVKEAIEKHGYSIPFNFKSLEEELKELKEEIKEETKFEKDTRVEVLQNVRNDYYEILNFDQSNNLIKQTDFNLLTYNNLVLYLNYWDDYYKMGERSSRFSLRKGSTNKSLFINDVEYSLKTTIKGEKRHITKKPHKKVEEDWDTRVKNYLEQTQNYKSLLEDFIKKDLKHVRTNLFIKPEYANIVESHLKVTAKEIEKYELEIHKIQNDYKKLKDEEVIVK